MSIVAVPLAIVIARQGGGAAVIVASLLAFVIGIWACGDHVRATGREDPSECVIDELAGQWLACACVCFAPASAAGIRDRFSALPPVRHSEALADLGGGETAGRPGRDGGRHAGGSGSRRSSPLPYNIRV